MRIFNRQTLTFSSNGSQQRQIALINAGFTVQGATAVLEGMDIQFANREDHHLGRLQVVLDTDVQGAAADIVQVTARFGLRDWSGGDADINGDDPIIGTIQYSVIVV